MKGYVPPYVPHPLRRLLGPFTARIRASGEDSEVHGGGPVLGAWPACPSDRAPRVLSWGCPPLPLGLWFSARPEALFCFGPRRN